MQVEHMLMNIIHCKIPTKITNKCYVHTHTFTVIINWLDVFEMDFPINTTKMTIPNEDEIN